jgi:hypothetical protein
MADSVSPVCGGLRQKHSRSKRCQIWMALMKGWNSQLSDICGIEIGLKTGAKKQSHFSPAGTYEHPLQLTVEYGYGKANGGLENAGTTIITDH